MKQVLRSLSLLLALIVTLPLAAACGNDTAPSEPAETSAAPATSAAETEPPETAPKRDIADVPDNTDLNGFSFRVYMRDVSFSDTAYTLFWTKEQTGEIINDEVFKRNTATEDKYNFRIERIETGTTGGNTITNKLKALVAANEDFAEIAIATVKTLSTVIVDSYLQPLSDVKTLNLSKGYWDQGLVNDLAVNGKVYMTTGEILVNDEDAFFATTFNSALAKDLGINDLYDKVRAGKWTLDEMEANMKKAVRDVNGDGVTDKDDSVGLLYVGNSPLQPFYAGTFTHVVEHDKNGKFVLADTARVFDVYDRVDKLLNTKGYAIDWLTFGSGGTAQIPVITTMFEQKRVLFQVSAISLMRRYYRDIQTDFGVLPMAKYDEAQDGYGSMLNITTIEAIVIPVTAKEAETAGTILEVMSAASYDLTDTFWNVCFQSKYTRDAESFEMLNIAREHTVYDPWVYYDFAKLMTDMKDGVMASTPIASLYESHREAAQKEIDKLNDYLPKK